MFTIIGLVRCARLSLNFIHSAPRWNVTCARVFWQAGGGLYIGGTATLTNTKVYSNEAGSVCLSFLELSSSAGMLTVVSCGRE